MPQRLKKPCAWPGCPELVEPGGRYCARHKKQEAQKYDRERGSARQRGYDSRWEKARRMFLRAYPLCVECQRQGRVEPATVVDHIIPHKGNYDLFWDMSNWQSLCKPCHDKKTAREGRWGEWQNRPQVVAVCGPPGSGKTRYVQEHKERGDLILDLDAIVMALSGLPMYDKPRAILPFAWEARDAILRRLEQPNDLKRAWIIAGAPKAAAREEMAQRFGATIIVLEVSEEECIQRIRHDERRWQAAGEWEEIVAAWWQEYEARPGDITLKW